MAVNVNETETKYDAPARAALPALDGLPQVAGTSTPAEEQLEAEYYDTEDLRLIRAGITLRRRRGGDDAGWHLKLPLDGDTRREIRLPLGRAGRQVPGELADLVRVHTRGEPLRPVARMTTTRQRMTLLGRAGESLAEVAADDVSAQTLGSSTAISRWHEVEVELTGGDRKLLKAADQLLRRDGLRPAARSAKLERALGGRLPAAGAPGAADAIVTGRPGCAGLPADADRKAQVARSDGAQRRARCRAPDAGGHPAVAQHAAVIRGNHPSREHAASGRRAQVARHRARGGTRW